MAQNENEPVIQQEKPNPVRRVTIGVVLTIVLGAVGSGVWDLVFKPGIGGLSKFITSVSTYIDDAVFTTAALDPSPLPGLMLVLLFTYFPILFAGMFAGFLFPRRFVRRAFGSVARQDKEDTEAYLQRLNEVERRVDKFRRITAVGGLAMALVVAAFARIAFSVVNEAVVVWRTFNQNIEICAPHVTHSELLEIRASFRKMKTRADFAAVRMSLDQVAAKNSFVIEWY